MKRSLLLVFSLLHASPHLFVIARKQQSDSSKPNTPEQIDLDDLSSLESESLSSSVAENEEELEERSKYIKKRFDSINIKKSGYIPPDPNGAAGRKSVVSVVNSVIEARNRNNGKLKYRSSLYDFFMPASPGGTFVFDPKIVYDQHEDRFVVVALNTNGERSFSYILVAVSKTGNPRSGTKKDWHFLRMDSFVGGAWADYPGLAVDEEAIYITSNMFGGSLKPSSLLWIVEKGVHRKKNKRSKKQQKKKRKKRGLYSGGRGKWKYYQFETDNFYSTYQPALIRMRRGAGHRIGTYLVSFGYGGTLSVVRVNNPLGRTTFTRDLVFAAVNDDLAGYTLDAPQRGHKCKIDTVGSRAMNAVWHGNSLWVSFSTILKGRTSAYWVKLDTSRVKNWRTPSGKIRFADGGGRLGWDITRDTYSFFPSIAVNKKGIVAIGFSASAKSIHPGAYVTLRNDKKDPRGTVRGTEVVRTGQGPYKIGSCSRNRWGDYSSVSVDPVDENCFWVYNEFAKSCSGNDCWGTAWAQVCYSKDKCKGSGCKSDDECKGSGCKRDSRIRMLRTSDELAYNTTDFTESREVVRRSLV